MLESVYISKVFPGTGPHLSLHSLCIFKVISVLQLLLEKHVVSALEALIWPFKWVILKEKARILLQWRRGMSNLNKQGSSAPWLT